MKTLLFLLLLALGIVFFVFYRQSHRVNIPELADFNIQKYMGKWYEIARTDISFERGLEQVYAEYAPGENGRIAVTNRGYSEESQEWQEARAYAVATPVKSHFKVYFFPLIAGNYQVAYVNEDYTLALVSGGTLGYLWILSRTPSISPEQKQQMLSLAKTLGYDVGKLHFTHHPTAETPKSKPVATRAPFPAP